MDFRFIQGKLVIKHDSGRIKKVHRRWVGKYRGRTYTVPALKFYECPASGEKVYDREAMRKIEARSPALVKARVS